MTAPTPTFPGRLDKGKLTLDEERRFRAWLKRQKDGRVDLIVRRAKSKRSLAQNAYMHGVVFPMVAEHTGYSIPETKLAMMGACFGWMFSELAKREVPVKPSTASMTVEENSYFIEWVPSWALEELGVQIPLPNECDVDSYVDLDAYAEQSA